METSKEVHRSILVLEKDNLQVLISGTWVGKMIMLGMGRETEAETCVEEEEEEGKERRGGEGRRRKEEDILPETMLKVSTLAGEKH